jgi:hypothetical protein
MPNNDEICKMREAVWEMIRKRHILRLSSLLQAMKSHPDIRTISLIALALYRPIRCSLPLQRKDIMLHLRGLMRRRVIFPSLNLPFTISVYSERVKLRELHFECTFPFRNGSGSCANRIPINICNGAPFTRKGEFRPVRKHRWRARNNWKSSGNLQPYETADSS